jgi:hypothetical protein
VTSKLLRPAALVLAGVLALGACTGGGDDEPEPSASATTAGVPQGFDVPDGVELTDPGSTVAPGTSVNVVWERPDAEPTVLGVSVGAVRKGSVKDLRFFSLDAQTRTATPYYVDVVAANRGPAALQNVQVPLLARDSGNVLTQPSRIVGQIKPCRANALPVSLAVGQSARACLVFLVPRGAQLQSIDLVTGQQADAVRWRPAA